MTRKLSQRPNSRSPHRAESQTMRTSAATMPAAYRHQPADVPSRAEAANEANTGRAPIVDRRPSLVIANSPARNAVHRAIVQTANSEPDDVPTGGTMEIRYLNAPNVSRHPWDRVAIDGITWPMALPFRATTGPMMNWASARNTICHHRRNGCFTPAKAMRQPSAVAGTAAAAQATASPYTSMRFDTESSVSAAMTATPARWRAHASCMAVADGRRPPRVIQITEWVESAHEPVLVFVPVPVRSSNDAADMEALVLALAMLAASAGEKRDESRGICGKVMRAPP